MSNKRKGFIAIILFFLIIAIALAVMPIIMQTTSYFAISETERAFFLAESGIFYYARHVLDGDGDWSDNNIQVTVNFAGGTFTITPQDQSIHTITLKSVGSVIVGAATFTRTIYYTIQRYDPFAFTIYGGSHCKGTTEQPCCDVDDSSCEAQDECCEGNISFEHITLGDINGTVGLVGDFTTTHSQNLEGPDELIEGASLPPVTVDWPYWEGIADQIINVGHTFDNATYGGPNATINGVYYVEGDVVIDLGGNSTINGTIIAEGDITIASTNLAANADPGMPSFIAGGDFNMGNGTNVVANGAIFAGEDINLDHATNLEVTGALIAGNDFNAEHTTRITLNPGDLVSDGFIYGGGGGFFDRFILSNFKEIDS